MHDMKTPLATQTPDASGIKQNTLDPQSKYAQEGNIRNKRNDMGIKTHSQTRIPEQVHLPTQNTTRKTPRHY